MVFQKKTKLAAKKRESAKRISDGSDSGASSLTLHPGGTQSKRPRSSSECEDERLFDVYNEGVDGFLVIDYDTDHEDLEDDESIYMDNLEESTNESSK